MPWILNGAPSAKPIRGMKKQGNTGKQFGIWGGKVLGVSWRTDGGDNDENETWEEFITVTEKQRLGTARGGKPTWGVNTVVDRKEPAKLLAGGHGGQVTKVFKLIRPLRNKSCTTGEKRHKAPSRVDTLGTRQKANGAWCFTIREKLGGLRTEWPISGKKGYEHQAEVLSEGWVPLLWVQKV